MKYQNRKPEEVLNEAVKAMRSQDAGPDAVKAATERVWQRLNEDATARPGELGSIRGCEDVRGLLLQYRRSELSPARALLVEDHLRECVACRKEAETGERPRAAALPWHQELARPTMPHFRWAMAAVALIAVGVSGYFVQGYFASPSGSRAQVASVSGELYLVRDGGEQLLKPGAEVGEGDRVRTAGASKALLRLRDGSVVEMNERAEMNVSLRYQDTTINLDRGNIIVQAAKRRKGHLYVAAQDCRVSVTGTVFSVNSGIKGSRVSVIEGEVRVAHAGTNAILHPGEQLATSASVSSVPVREEIAWSQNLDKHLALLAEFARLSNKLEAVQMPGLRYQSKLLPLLPQNTALYGSIPNLADAVQQANQLFQQELQSSAVLREWWQQAQPGNGAAKFEEAVQEVHDLGQYIGNEIVFSVAIDDEKGSPLVVAAVQRPGLKEYIEREVALHVGSKPYPVHVFDEAGLLHASATGQRHEALVLVRPDVVAVTFNLETLKKFDAQLRSGGGGFAGTPFGQRMAGAYEHGAGMLFGADLRRMANRTQYHSAAGKAAAEKSGLIDVEYLVVERREVGSQTVNQAQLSFINARHGFASWLAAPAPIGGLSFVSKDAGAVASFIAKKPSEMMDDILAVATSSNPEAGTNLAKEEAELKINLRQDLAATLGGEVTFALDGPILPTPAWKIIAEVNDPARLQATIRQLVDDVNEHPSRHSNNGPKLALDEQTVNGLDYYTIRTIEGTKPVEFTYTYTDGYMILAATRALVMNAITIHHSGNSLAQSTEFRALLPQDGHADVSALLYQNLAPVVGPIMGQLTPSQLQALQQLAAESKPSLVCAYGEEKSIEIASNTKLFGANLNSLALSALLRASHPQGRAFQ